MRVGDRRGQTGFTQHAVPGMQILFAGVDDADLPDQQHLGGILQMRLVGAFKIADKLIARRFTELVNHRLDRHRGDPQPLA